MESSTQPEIPYQEFVRRLVKPGEDIIASLNPARANLWHMASALPAEAGELFDAVKKLVIYEKPLDRENVVEELGDMMFYMTEIKRVLGISDEEVESFNRNKLAKRFASLSFTNEEAQTRADKA